MKIPSFFWKPSHKLACNMGYDPTSILPSSIWDVKLERGHLFCLEWSDAQNLGQWKDGELSDQYTVHYTPVPQRDDVFSGEPYASAVRYDRHTPSKRSLRFHVAAVPV